MNLVKIYFCKKRYKYLCSLIDQLITSHEKEIYWKIRTKIIQIKPEMQEISRYLKESSTMNDIYFHTLAGYCSDDISPLIDRINYFHGAINFHIKSQWIYWIKPWNWLIEIVALIIRFPFIILEKSGLPKKFEDTIWAHVIKVAIFFLISYLVSKGLVPPLGGSVLRMQNANLSAQQTSVNQQNGHTRDHADSGTGASAK